MRARVATFIILTALAVSPAPQAQAPAGDDDVDRDVLAEMKRQQIPGLSLAVVKDGKLVKARGCGFADVEHVVAATERTMRAVFVGCDPMAALGVERYGAVVDRYCHVKLPLTSGGRVVTFRITKDERLAGFMSYEY